MRFYPVVLTLFLGACTSSAPHSFLMDTVVGDHRVVARDDIEGITRHHSGLSSEKTHVIFVITPTSEKQFGDPGYEACYPAMIAYEQCLRDIGSKVVTRSASIRAVDAAISRSPNCSWKGFDPAYDARLRAVGALAQADDYRLLFAALDCT